MNESLRWQLIVGCLMIVALEAPRTSLVLAEDLGGPYAVHGRSALDAAPPAPRGVAARDVGTADIERGEELLAFDRDRDTRAGVSRR
jgi:hypothetical protein